MPGLYLVMLVQMQPVNCMPQSVQSCLIKKSCVRSRREGERSSKRKRHHAEHAEPAAPQHVPAQAVPASDAGVKLEADQVVSPGKRIKKESAAVPVKASILDHLTIADPLTLLAQLVHSWEAMDRHRASCM